MASAQDGQVAGGAHKKCMHNFVWVQRTKFHLFSTEKLKSKDLLPNSHEAKGVFLKRDQFLQVLGVLLASPRSQKGTPNLEKHPKRFQLTSTCGLFLGACFEGPGKTTYPGAPQSKRGRHFHSVLHDAIEGLRAHGSSCTRGSPNFAWCCSLLLKP